MSHLYKIFKSLTLSKFDGTYLFRMDQTFMEGNPFARQFNPARSCFSSVDQNCFRSKPLTSSKLLQNFLEAERI